MFIQYCIGALLLLLLLLNISIKGFKKRLLPPKMETVFTVLSLFLIFSMYLINLLIGMGVAAETIRTIVISITMVIAMISFLSTFWFSNKNIHFTRDTQNSNFIMTLIASNYKILEIKQVKIDDLVSYLQKQFLRNGYHFDELVSKFIDHIKVNVGVIDLINKIGEQSTNKDYKRQLKNLTAEFDKEQAARLIMTYLSQNDRYKDFYKKIDETESNKTFNGEIAKIMEKQGLFEEINRFMNAHFEDTVAKKLDYDVISIVCNKAFDMHYQDIGHFFRNSYRIVKFINEQYKDDIESKKKFLGILRSQYSENTILAIFYNSAFTDKGLGYGKELVCSDFFGTKDDLIGHQPIHFKQSNLISQRSDIDLMLRVFCSEASINEEDQKDFKSTLKKFYV